MKDYDRRLVELYDGDNPDGPDHDFYRALADQIKARSVLDIGCGTGILTVTFARHGRSVVGLDPSATMLDYARRRPSGEGVHWVLGDSREIPGSEFDYAVMTGNVAQHIPESDWCRTLRDLRKAMRPGAVLAFESRNPAARAWERWEQPSPSVRDTIHGPLREWTHAKEIDAGVIELVFHSVFETTGDHVAEEQRLTFRTQRLIEDTLKAAGFEVRHVWGDWAGTAFDGTQELMVFESAVRP